MLEINETAINFIAESTRIQGKVTFDKITRVHGILVGEVQAKDGSTLILSETAVVEGNIHADTLIIDGFVQGNIIAKSKVVISRTGKMIGDIKTPSLNLEFGSFFQGKCSMEKNP